MGLLIRNASRLDGSPVAVRVSELGVEAVEGDLPPLPGEPVFEARGGLVLPGLNDHHLHLWAAAAAFDSVPCGPPVVRDSAALAAALAAAADNRAPGSPLRGIRWHPSVMSPGDRLDRDWLDRHGPARPIRIQHRSGRLWVMNSAELARLGLSEATAPPAFERRYGRLTGRVLDGDAWLKAHQPDHRPCLNRLSRALAARGVVGITDTTPQNSRDELLRYAAARGRGALLQRLRVMGDESLDGATEEGLSVGEAKFHLHEHALPDFEALVAAIRARHAAGRAAAFHATSRIELVYALSALEAAGASGHDRIEHAGIVPPECLEPMRDLGVTVVSQPHFIREKGVSYRREVALDDQPWLYRLRVFDEAGVPLAAGSDAPFGGLDPWAAMQAAVDRRDAEGVAIGATEALSPERALALFLGPLDRPGGADPALRAGMPADLCVLDRPWRGARQRLDAVQVWLTLIGGAIVHGPTSLAAGRHFG